VPDFQICSRELQPAFGFRITFRVSSPERGLKPATTYWDIPTSRKSAIMRRMKALDASQPASASSIARELYLYFALAYGISFAFWTPVLFGSRLSFLFLPVGMFGPTLAALSTHRLMQGNWKAVRLWTDLPHFLLGIALGGSAVLVSALSAAFFMTKSGFDRWQWSALLQIVTLFVPNLFGGPLSEEPGWRGYALVRLQRRLNPVTSSLILGFLWANWHFPLILTHVYNVTWWQFLFVTMAASVFLSFAFNKSSGSTLCTVVVGCTTLEPESS